MSRPAFAPELEFAAVKQRPGRRGSWQRGPVMVGGKLRDLRTEAHIAAQVREWLTRRGFKLMRPDPGRGNLGKHNAGIPDILTVLLDGSGRLFAIECKAPGAKAKWESQRPDRHQEQRDMLDWLAEHKAIVVVATCVEDVQRALEQHGKDADGLAG